MRTLLYIHAPSVVTISAPQAGDPKAAIARYKQPLISALGVHELDPGIYMVQSERPVEITVQSVAVITLGNDKDDWPDPKLNALELEPGATAASIRSYFQLAKDASPR